RAAFRQSAGAPRLSRASWLRGLTSDEGQGNSPDVHCILPALCVCSHSGLPACHHVGRSLQLSRVHPPRHFVALTVPPNGCQQSLPELVANLPHDRRVGRKRNHPATSRADGIHSVPLLHDQTVQRIVFTATVRVRICTSQRQSIRARLLFVVQRLRYRLWVAGGKPLVPVSLPPDRSSGHV